MAQTQTVAVFLAELLASLTRKVGTLVRNLTNVPVLEIRSVMRNVPSQVTDNYLDTAI